MMKQEPVYRIDCDGETVFSIYADGTTAIKGIIQTK